MKWDDVLGTSGKLTLRAPLSFKDDRRLELKALYIKKQALEEKLREIEKEQSQHRRAMLLKYDHTQGAKN